MFYFTALIPDSTSQASYDSIVLARVSRTFVQDTTDTVAISSMIEKIRAEELAPYILFDSTLLTNSRNALGVNSIAAAKAAATKIYPNPTTNTLNVSLGQSFTNGIPVIIELYSIDGKLIKTITNSYSSGVPISFDISYLPNADYYIEIKQNNSKEYHKFVKNDPQK